MFKAIEYTTVPITLDTMDGRDTLEAVLKNGELAYCLKNGHPTVLDGNTWFQVKQALYSD